MLRTFKTAHFSKLAKKAKIADQELCQTIAEVRLGQAVDLGGGVFKKRLSKNAYRSIVLAKCGKRWVFEYLFAKNQRENISSNELDDLRLLAKSYANLTDLQLNQLLAENFLLEICHDTLN